MSGRHVHLLTPGDHFSPRTGSAVPTVVHGLASAGTGPRAAVLVARGTYTPRYTSADVVEYDDAPPRRTDRYLDLVAGTIGVTRPGARRRLAAALRAQHSWPGSVVLAHNAPQAVPLVAARHAPVLYAHNQLLRTYGEREAGRVLDPVSAVVCVSEYLAEETARMLPPRLRDRVRAVPNGVDVEAFDGPRPPREGVTRVAFVGRVIRDKGVHVLLDAVRRLDRPDLQVTVVGRPGFAADAPLTAYEQELRRAAAGTRTTVEFASFVPRPALPAILRSTDVLVVPSAWPEPFGLTALEGMAAGAAVVASDVGGLPEAVGDGGLLVPPGDVAALAEALEALADDAGLLGRTQAAGRSRAGRLTWAHARERLDDALSGTIGHDAEAR
ncbi:glycosyltransferase family 4 protein [Cellulosimicrobium protaetiae]|uniref:Glycosyltransferase family 4 protein n=1 Tax=Cellulosimicrobium protaetiae TaxID=2587808 RepID=A0A6M5UFJ7_9MICO|nr:glycosyltransferase family 4 protein [Cellulosimicrobium protaetiae]QJW35983.1 glycosyltransferase family 4 protein [Cellulosimicrobium protaetiae]